MTQLTMFIRCSVRVWTSTIGAVNNNCLEGVYAPEDWFGQIIHIMFLQTHMGKVSFEISKSVTLGVTNRSKSTKSTTNGPNL